MPGISLTWHLDKQRHIPLSCLPCHVVLHAAKRTPRKVTRDLQSAVRRPKPQSSAATVFLWNNSNHRNAICYQVPLRFDEKAAVEMLHSICSAAAGGPSPPNPFPGHATPRLVTEHNLVAAKFSCRLSHFKPVGLPWRSRSKIAHSFRRLSCCPLAEWM